MNIGLLTLTFVAVNLDFFVMLIFLLHRQSLATVLIGYWLGLMTLLIISFVVGKVLSTWLPEYLLGLLGFLPIYLALKPDEPDQPSLEKAAPVLAVMLTYWSVCAGCNLAIFVPVLIGMSLPGFLATIGYFSILLVIIVLLLKLIEQQNIIQSGLQRYGNVLMRVCYFTIGCYVLFESGFVAQAWHWIISI
ncbi:integral membrane protein [Fructilactobacillus florum 8D]|uniref:Integral membrane protein n=1 Tax=Fructilactobacillus florum 8D TaxID=1221538 RepID=W9EGF5_9LACO|nr:cadmium resistance transporter [Fructilactobacillus florum]EKK20090.1 integral membrane protein [Fructilactobacillus florum 2F]ETO40070.1 integral membrane protein [Fructilactobacillus florum 8D]